MGELRTGQEEEKTRADAAEEALSKLKSAQEQRVREAEEEVGRELGALKEELKRLKLEGEGRRRRRRKLWRSWQSSSQSKQRREDVKLRLRRV